MSNSDHDQGESSGSDVDRRLSANTHLSTTSSESSPSVVAPSFTRTTHSERPSILIATLLEKSEGPLKSPSSPNISNINVIPQPNASDFVTLTRSNTLPHVSEEKPSHQRRIFIHGLRGLVVDAEVLVKVQKWILSLVIVDFDLDCGPVVSGTYPPLSLTSPEAENIAFSSFPDSLQFDQGSQVHSFRIQDCLGQSGTINQERPPSHDGFMYCYSHFTQRRDLTSKRGYQQQSLVILTHHQYPALFSSLSFTLGPLYQTHGIPMLETACHNIAKWPFPTPGSTLELGFLGSIIHVELPHTPNSQQLTDTSSFKETYDPKRHILASSTPLTPPLLSLFEASLPHLWSIWECLVLCEPILVFGSSPAMTSQAIWWFRDLMRPIPLAGDIRPYFTIHDNDHSLLVNKLPPKAGVLLGVTNPFFERSCMHWPHILSLGRSSYSSTNSLRTHGPEPGWKTKTHKRYISKDRPLLKQLERAFNSGEQAKMEASLILRCHLTARTTALLVPLNRYLNTLIPSPAECSSSIHRLKSFNSNNFFASLKVHGSPLPFRSTTKRREFYERWLKTPNFGVWLAQQEDVVSRVLQGNGDLQH